MRYEEGGFTLIELLIVVAIIGIIAAIAIPNMILAIDRARQKRSMGETRSVATALHEYGTDTNQFPPGSGGFAAVDPAIGVPGLIPDYVKSIPTQDPWGFQYEYAADDKGTDFAYRGKGRGGQPDSPAFPAILSSTISRTTCFECDIVWVDSALLFFPDGKQKSCQ